MLKWLKLWVAKYDHWCAQMRLVPENRRCCAPIRYDDDDPRHPSRRREACSTESPQPREETITRESNHVH